MAFTGTVTNKLTGLPLVGVAVTDGRHTVLTDEEGKYSLPGWERSNTLGVCLLTLSHDDWFRYTGGVEGTYDFQLTPAPEVDQLTILQTSDTEINEKSNLEWMDYIKECIAAEKPAILMHTGDICGRRGLPIHKEIMNYDTMGCPVRYVVGNHDFVPSDADYGEQYFEQLYGPTWWFFPYGGVWNVVLSLGHGGARDMATGYPREDQWTWLRNLLELKDKDMPVVIFCHDQGPDPFTYILGDIDMVSHGLLAWIYGHSHSPLQLVRSGVHSICTGRPDSGGIDSSPAHLRITTVENKQVTSRLLYRRFPKDEADTPVWQTRLPGKITFCRPVDNGDTLLVAAGVDELPGKSAVYCIRKETGGICWEFETMGAVHGNMSLDEGKLYVQDKKGFVHCLDAATGKLIWQQPLRMSRTHRGATVVGDLVLCGKSNHTIALDKRTGETCWDSPPTPGGAMGETPARTVMDSKRGRVLVNCQWGSLMSIDAVTGQRYWERKDKPLWYRTGTPCVDGDFVYTGGFNKLQKLDAVTGETLLEGDLGTVAEEMGAPRVESDGQCNGSGAAAVDGDVLYCPTASAGVLAVDKNTLEVLRRFPCGTAALLTAPYVMKGCQTVEDTPIVRGDTLIFAANDGKVYFYDKHTAQLQKAITLPGAPLVAPVVEEDVMYTVDFDGNVCKYKM